MRFPIFLSNLLKIKGGVLFKNCLKWWILSFLSLVLGRIVFFLSNASRFSKIQLSDHFYGVWIDVITTSLYLFPIFCAVFLLHFIFPKKWLVQLTNFVIGIVFFWFLTTNLIDTAYFKYRFSRSTRELFEMLLVKMDFVTQFGGIFQSYWSFFLLFLIALLLWVKIMRSWISVRLCRSNWKESIAFVLLLGIVFLLGRGGIRPRPIGVMDLSRVSQNPNLVANTPFLLLKSVASVQIPDYQFMDKKKAHLKTQFHQKTSPENILPDSTNLIVIVLESFGNEFVKKKKNTPFLNSILKKSWSLNRAFANGLTSSEAIPAIVSSMPKFSNVDYFSSNYGNNSLDGIASILKKNGYKTTFFHGASNGSMMLDAFSSVAQFDKYYGRNEYGNDAHFDGRWGIFDTPFLKWSAQEIKNLPSPFFSLIFTLSSHHPYIVPSNLKSDLTFKTPIENATFYADFSLKKFFERVEKMDWFENTLFVFVADHTSKNRKNVHPLDIYKIPLAFYHPKVDLSKIKNQPIATQIDVFPTVLDFLNVEADFYSAGKSLFQKQDDWSFIKGRNSFFYLNNENILSFQLQNENELSIFEFVDWNEKKAEKRGESEKKGISTSSFDFATLKLQAFLQQLTQDVKSNQTTYNEKKYSIHN